MQFSRYK